MITDIYSKIIVSLLILTGTLFAGWLVNQIFEQACRWAVGKTKTDFDDKLIVGLRRPVLLSVLLTGIYAAVLPLSLSANILIFFKKSLITALLLLLGLAILRAVRLSFEELHKRIEPERIEMLHDLIPFLDNVTKVVVAVTIFLTILSLWGIDITPALASAGVAGIAVAFAARDTVANVFGGVSVFFDKPYKSGDYVVVEGKYRGEVVQIGMRSTKIRTRDNVLLTVPNSVMVTNTVVNETGFDPKLRIRIPLGVAYGTDLEEAEEILIDVARKHKKIIDRPTPRVRYRRFGDSSIELELLAVIAKPAERGRIIHELIKRIDRRFRKEGINIPFPQRDVHLYTKKEA